MTSFPIEKGKPKPKVAGKAKANKKVSQKRLMLKADTLFSRLIRLPGRCFICGSTQFLQCAHGFSRRYRAVRFDSRNAWPLCSKHHVFYTHRPLEWDCWMREQMGEELYEEIRVLALTGPNPDLQAEVWRLESLLRESDAA